MTMSGKKHSIAARKKIGDSLRGRSIPHPRNLPNWDETKQKYIYKGFICRDCGHYINEVRKRSMLCAKCSQKKALAAAVGMKDKKGPFWDAYVRAMKNYFNKL